LRGHDDIVQLLLNRGQMWIKRRRILWPNAWKTWSMCDE
jgi:hypothetical protein